MIMTYRSLEGSAIQEGPIGLLQVIGCRIRNSVWFRHAIHVGRVIENV